MKKALPTELIVICGAMLSSATPAGAGEIFFDEARVLDSQPVYETRQAPVQVQQWGYQDDVAPGRAETGLLGAARSSDPAVVP